MLLGYNAVSIGGGSIFAVGSPGVLPQLAPRHQPGLLDSLAKRAEAPSSRQAHRRRIRRPASPRGLGAGIGGHNVYPGGRLLTLASSALRNDLDVWLYVKDVLDQLLAGSTDYDRLLPWKWAASHPEAIRTYRVEERRDCSAHRAARRANRRNGSRSA